MYTRLRGGNRDLSDVGDSEPDGDSLDLSDIEEEEEEEEEEEDKESGNNIEAPPTTDALREWFRIACLADVATVRGQLHVRAMHAVVTTPFYR
jgi:hypothetical protein